jgi:16S rRNA (guanine966-N2)-methyltransferase
LRIIAGTAKGRRLYTPAKSTAKLPGRSIRPTADRAREALFSIIGREVENARVLDLYAGTGALGLEALSRSAARAVFVDSSRQAIGIIRKNIKLCGFTERAVVFRRDLIKGFSFLARQVEGISFSLVFIDPPYRMGFAPKIVQELADADIVLPGALAVLEESADTEPVDQVEGIELVDRRNYGDTGFFFYRKG